MDADFLILLVTVHKIKFSWRVTLHPQTKKILFIFSRIGKIYEKVLVCILR
jgi:hypothetical protein